MNDDLSGQQRDNSARRRGPRREVTYQMILRFLRVTWFHFYDELPRNLLMNLFALVGCVVPLPLLGIPVSLCAISGYANRLIRFQDPELRVFLREYQRWFGRGLLFGWAYFALFIPLLSSFWFYGRYAADFGIFGYGLAGICFWVLVFYVLMGVYFFPLVVHQREGLVKTFKRSAIAVLIRPGLVLAGAATFLLWVMVCWIVPPLFFLVPLIWLAISGNVGLLLLLDEYDDEVPNV